MAKQLQIWIKAISDDQLIVLFSYVTYFASLYTGARLFLHCNLSCHYTLWIHSLCSLTPFVKKIKALNMTKLGKSQLILIYSGDSYFKNVTNIDFDNWLWSFTTVSKEPKIFLSTLNVLSSFFLSCFPS